MKHNFVAGWTVNQKLFIWVLWRPLGRALAARDAQLRVQCGDNTGQTWMKSRFRLLTSQLDMSISKSGTGYLAASFNWGAWLVRIWTPYYSSEKGAPIKLPSLPEPSAYHLYLVPIKLRRQHWPLRWFILFYSIYLNIWFCFNFELE